MGFFVALLIHGLLAGALYALLALAFVVVYKASRLINFALGDCAMFAARLAAAGWHGLGLGLVGALGFGCASMVALALGVNRLVLRPLVGSPVIALLMVTIGLGTVVRAAAFFLFQGLPAGLPLPLPREPWVIQGVLLSVDELVAAGIALHCIALVSWAFQRSRLGVALRAMADDQQAAMLVGIDLHRYVALTWALMGLLCVVAGTLWTFRAGGGVGVVLVGLKVLPIVIIGGLDSLPGTLLGALVVGLLESMAAGYLDPLVGGGFSTIAAYLVALVVLWMRPYGLLGTPDIERV
jgi:branched-chain amino acid transport system permease protein